MRSLIKYFGLGLILAGFAIFFFSSSFAAEIPLLVGLFVLFISRERREDERVVQIKASSALLALIVGYALKLIVSDLYDHQIIKFDLVSINYFLIVVFGLANIIRFSRLYFYKR